MRARIHAGVGRSDGESEQHFFDSENSVFLVLLTGSEPLVMESIESWGRRSTNWATPSPSHPVIPGIVFCLFLGGGGVLFTAMRSISKCDPRLTLNKLAGKITRSWRKHHLHGSFYPFILFNVFTLKGVYFFYHTLTAHSQYRAIHDFKTHFKLQKPTLTEAL